jgi:hypothetical protein
MKKYFKWMLFVPFLMSFQCEDNDPVPLDKLEETGLFGRWEIQDEAMNGVISDMLPRCCEFLEFQPDDNVRDYLGMLTYTGNGLVNRGSFEVDIINHTVLFIDDDNDEFTFEFEVDQAQEQLTIDFTEDGANFTQTWLKIE